MKTFILTLILLIGISSTAWPQLYYTGKVNFGEETYACWQYADAAKLINAGIKSYELEEQNKRMSLINDSLMFQLSLSGTKFNTAMEALETCKSKEINYSIIQENHDIEIDLMLDEIKTWKIKFWSLTGVAVLILTLVVIK